VGLSGRGRRRRRGAAVGVVRSGRHRASRVEQETERKDGRAGAFGWDCWVFWVKERGEAQQFF
jgi:hypothetical protein